MPSWEPPLPEELQALLPQYEITGILGRGGMGAVYKGRQAKLDRDVAIKVLPETLTADGDEMNYAKRFEQEARAMAKLDHPAIISVYDFGETSAGQLYFVMEFIDGMDIRQYLQQQGGRLSQNDSIAIIAHVLDALAYAHSHGIVHRDIKPANILLNRDGRVKIADFGLAKRFDTDDSALGLTMSNMAVGTPDFLAPESLETGRKVDQRADLYAVGVMLYQLLTGKLPRGGFDLPSEMFPELDPRLDDIFVKAFSADPDYRYPSASAVRADLDEVLSQPRSRLEMEAVAAALASTPPPSRVKPQPAPPSKAPLYTGIGVAAALVVSAVVFFATRPESSTGTLPVASAEKTDDKGQTPVAAKPADPPAEPIAKTPERGTGILPVASAEKADAQEPAPVVEKLVVAPAEPIGKMPMPPEEEPTPAVAASAPPAEPAPVPDKAVAPEPSGGTPLPPSPPSPPEATPPPLPPELATLDTQFRALQAERVTAPYEADLAKLNAQYLGGLDKAIATEKAAGRLDGVLAVEAEKALVGDRQPVPEADGEGDPESLKKLRAIWRAEQARLLDERGDHLRSLTGPLDKRLAQLEADFTKADRLADAKTVRGYREALEEGEGSAGTPARNAPGLASSAPLDPLRTLELKEGFTNSLGMKFVPVKGTEVMFCIHETRYQDYAAFAEESPGIRDAWKNQTVDGYEITERQGEHPVIHVSWEGAQKFCEWLSQKEGRTYRLPTDREWSVAVGIGRDEKWGKDTTPATVSKDSKEFPWGDEWPPPKGAGNYADRSRMEKMAARAGYIKDYDDGFPTTAPVMSFKPNRFGLYDMGGNVREWVEDWWDEEKKEHVLRSNAFYFGESPRHLVSSVRSHVAPNDAYAHGFRIVFVPPAPTSAPAGKASRVPDDRAAAEMILGKGGVAVVESSREPRREAKALEDLPKGSFDVLELRLESSSLNPPTPLSEEDMRSLSGLKRLEELTLHNTTLSGPSLSVLRSLPALRRLRLSCSENLTDEGLLHVAALEGLKMLNLEACSGLTSAGILHLAPLKNLESLHLTGLPRLDGEALPAILEMRRVRTLYISGATKVDKAFLEALAGLPELGTLYLSQDSLAEPVELGRLKELRTLSILGSNRPFGEATSGSLAGLKSLESLLFLGAVSSSSSDPEVAEALLQQVAMLPALRQLSFRNVRLPESRLAALQGSKITRVGTQLGSGDTRFDDATLASLIPLESLQKVVLGRRSPVTAEGLDAFRQARPDVKIEGR